MFLQRPKRVLEVHPDRARIPRVARRADRIAVPRFEVRAHGHVNVTHDALDGREHLGTGDLLTVRITVDSRDRPACGCDRRKARFGEHMRARDVPRIRQYEQVRPSVKGA